MRILDRYIITSFFSPLFISVIGFSGIFIIVNMIDMLDKFLSNHVPFLVVVKYYIYHFPYVFLLVLPVSLLMSALFSLSQLVKHGEILAMKSSGVSVYRMLSPLIILGFLISLMALVFGEYVVPFGSKKKNDISRQYIHKAELSGGGRSIVMYFLDSANRVVYIKYFDKRTNRATRVTIVENSGATVTRRIFAKKMFWEDDCWVLSDVKERKFQNDEMTLIDHKLFPMKELSFTPGDLGKVQVKPIEMNYRELSSYVENLKRLGIEYEKWLVDLHLKISFPFANFIILLFGAPIAVKFRKGGAAAGFGLSLFICFFYFGIIHVGQALGQKDAINPFTAAWMGNYIMFVIGSILFWSSRK